MKRSYELTVVFSPQLNEKDLTASLKAVEVVVDKAGGKMGRVVDWGKKDLSYPIKKETQGVYKFWPVELLTDKAHEAEKELRLKEGILRFLLVKKGGKDGNKVAK